MAGYKQSEAGSLDNAAMAESAKIGRLRELLLGQQADAAKVERGAELKNQAIASNRTAAEDFANQQGLKPGKYAVSANESGYNVNPEAVDPLSAFFRKQAFDAQQEDRDEKKVEKLSGRVEKANLGPSQTALTGLGNSIKENGVALGPVSSALPAWMVSAGEQLGMASPGATEQKQSVAALQAFQRNPLFGASLTPGEQQEFQNAFGLLTGGDEKQRVQAMQRLEQLHNKATQNVAAGFPQRIREKYKQQGGIPLEASNVMGGAPEAPAPDAAAAARKARIAELKAKHGQ